MLNHDHGKQVKSEIRNPKLEHNHLIGGQRPIASQVDATQLHPVDQILRPEPAGLATGASDGHLAPPGQRRQHPLNVVISIGRLLATFGAGDTITNQEDANRRLGALDQIQGQAQGIVGSLITVRAVIQDEQNVL
jgi:hypothetical protein